MDKYANIMDSYAVNNINNIKYDKKPSDDDFTEMNRKTKLVTIDWKNILPEPPDNTSDITKKELEYLEKITNNLSRKVDLVMKVDANPVNLFLPILKDQRFGISTAKLYDRCLYQLKSNHIKTKDKYLRPRPEQLASVYNRKINTITTASHHTPAYPSGHVAQGGMCAALLSWMYPDLSSKFYGLVETVGMARMLQGVHYPSDNDAGMLLSAAIWEDKHKINAPRNMGSVITPLPPKRGEEYYGL